jgi:hypothetical protein
MRSRILRMNEFLRKLEHHQDGQAAGYSNGNIVAVQRPEMVQRASRREENDAGQDRGGGDHPPQGRVWPQERGKRGSAKGAVYKHEAKVGRNQGRESQRTGIGLREALAQRHDEEAGDQREDQYSLEKALDHKAGGEQRFGRAARRPAHCVALLALGFEHDRVLAAKAKRG